MRRSASRSGEAVGVAVGAAVGGGVAVAAAPDVGLGTPLDGDGAGAEGAGLAERGGTQAASQAATPATPRPWRNLRRDRTVSRTAAA